MTVQRACALGYTLQRSPLGPAGGWLVLRWGRALAARPSLPAAFAYLRLCVATVHLRGGDMLRPMRSNP